MEQRHPLLGLKIFSFCQDWGQSVLIMRVQSVREWHAKCFVGSLHGGCRQRHPLWGLKIFSFCQDWGQSVFIMRDQNQYFGWAIWGFHGLLHFTYIVIDSSNDPIKQIVRKLCLFKLWQSPSWRVPATAPSLGAQKLFFLSRLRSMCVHNQGPKCSGMAC